MKIKILTDNKAKEGFKGEWGLSVYIEHKGIKGFIIDNNEAIENFITSKNPSSFLGRGVF